MQSFKCPKCGRKVLKKELRKTRGKCSHCGFLLSGLIAKFSSARSRVRSKYAK
jgi:ribosomal protein L37AE/L43A